MQIARRAALAVFGSALLAPAVPVPLAADVTEKNMTQRDYNRLVQIGNSVKGKDADKVEKVPIDPIHDLNPAERKDLQDEWHGVRVIKGKDWQREDPVERDAHLRRILSTAPEGTKFLIEIPSGNVWLLPPESEAEKKILRIPLYRRWLQYQYEALPVSVSPVPQTTQSDRHGSGNNFVARVRVRL